MRFPLLIGVLLLPLTALLALSSRLSEAPVTSSKDWPERRADILKRMQDVMGPVPDRSHLSPLDVKVTAEEKLDGYVRLTLTFLAEPGDRVPAQLYLPTSTPTAKKRPALLALHQTSPQGKREVGGDAKNPNMAYAPELARRGYVVLCPDYPSFGDYKYDFAKSGYASGTMKGVFNHMRCVDLLQSRDDVDGGRVGAIGHSLGGHNAMFLGAFDERVKVVVSSCGWTPFADYYGGNIKGWTGDRYMPRLRDVYHLDPKQVPFEFDEVVASIAPRALFSNSPLHDDNFNVEGVKKAVRTAQQVYDVLGVGANLQVRHPDCAHDFPPEMRLEAYAFIDKALNHVPPREEDYSAELPRIPPHEPHDALETFQVHPGFHLEQVAAEPMVRSPVALCFDENGRCFVVEMADYSEQDKDFLGSVRMLEDIDGDGRFDRSTVYADHLSWPTAIACYDGGVFVGAAPDVFYLKDTDGDGKADVRKVVFTGFRRDNVQGLLNSFCWTLDNRFHGATSLSGAGVGRPDVRDAKALDLNGRDFSFDPKKLDLRPESGGAQHGLSFDDWGRKFVCSNSDHIQAVMFEDQDLERNPYLPAPGPRISIAADGPQARVFRISPVEPWRVLRTRLRVAGLATGPVEGGGQPAGYFTGATGTTIYRGDAFPLEYRGQAFIGDVGSNIVHRKVIEPDGVGFVAKRVDEGAEFVASTDNWFRPVQFANAPDGTLYILDMYREVIEHPASLPPEIKKHLDLTSGRDRGRIYRLVPDGFRQRPPPRLGAMTTAELVAQLEHRNGWHRDTAARLLYERADESAAGPLTKLAPSSSLPEARMHALHALAGLGKLTPDVLLPRLSDDHPRVREHAARLAGRVSPGSREVESRLVELVNDADARVRYQVAFTAGSLPVAARRPVIATLLKRDGGDPWLRLAAFTSVGDDAAATLGQLLDDRDWAHLPHAPEVTRQLARQVAARGDAKDVQSLAATLGRLADSGGAVAEAALDGLLLDDPGGASALNGAEGEALRPLLASRLEHARNVAVGKQNPTPARVDAIRTLAAGGEDARRLLADLLDNRQPPDVQLAALQTLARFDHPAVGRTIVGAWPGFTPRIRAAAAGVLFSRPAYLPAVLDALEAGRLSPFDVEPARLRQLESSDDPELRERAATLLAGAARKDREEVIASYRAALQLKGDPAKGRTIFRNTCAPCHRLEGFGHEIGPNLSAMANRGAEAILVNLLDPNREVTPQYVDFVVETTDGRTLTGMLASETATSVTLKRAEDATDTVLRGNIKRMRSGRVSIMPEGLEQQLDQQAVADLIAYITSAK